ncbi:MAG: fimbrillin family protein, partial [Prevotella sp.]|nr:fimbrillin family protein [Prevotella sp.]
MKKLYMLSLTALLMAACAEEVTEKGNNGDFITFNVTDNNLLPEPTVSTAAAEVPSFFNQTTPQTTVTAPIVSTPEPVKVETDLQLDEPLYMTTTVEKGIHATTSEASTMRGTLVNTGGTLNFGVTEYKNDPDDPDDPETAIFTNASLSTTANTTAQTVSTTKTWESDANTNAYDFYAYAPYLSETADGLGLTLSGDGKTVTYDASAVTLANQKDLMTAYASSTYNKDGVDLEFGHRLTAVTVKLNSSWSSTYTIKSIVFNNIDYAGDCSLTDGSWSNMTNGNYTVNAITESSTASANVAANLMMIPQTFGSGTKMTITLQETANSSYTHTLTASLSGTWKPGYTVTYEIGAQGISTFQAVYPNGANAWGGTTQGPVSAYQTTAANANEAFGMYVADTDGNLVYSNIKMNVASVSSYTATLSVASNPGYFFSKSYRYFLYYPYKSTYDANSVTAKSGGVAVTDADTFLG